MATFTRRDFLKLSGAAALSAAFSSVAAGTAGMAGPSVIYHGSRNTRKLAMTFDDCWHPEVLQQLIDMLDPYPDFHFTFFAIGDAVEIDEALRPGIWKAVLQRGHELGYHTYHHVDPQIMSTSSLLEDFDQWMTLMQKVLGYSPQVRFARPPYDDLSLSWQELCRKRGLVATLYSAGYESPSMDESMRLASQATNGDIVQMHTYQDPPHGRYDVDITAKVVPYLAEKGFTLVTMSQLYDDVLRDAYNADGCDVGA